MVVVGMDGWMEAFQQLVSLVALCERQTAEVVATGIDQEMLTY